MSEETKSTEQTVEPNQVQKPMEIEVDAQTAMMVRLQEFDKNIAAHKAEASRLEAEKANFIYQTNIEAITKQHQAKGETK